MSEMLVTLRLDGDLEQGFRVILEIGREGERPQGEWQGSLPAQPDLASVLNQWRRSYRELAGTARIIPQEIIYGGSINRLENCRQLGQQLGTQFTQWLRTESFRTLDLRLREELQRQDSIRILLRSPDPLVRHLPWYRWDLVERFPRSELLLSASSFERSVLSESLRPRGRVGDQISDRRNRQLPAKSTLGSRQFAKPAGEPVRILAILGHSCGIDVESDRALLNQLPDAEVTFLVEPQRQQLHDQLWEQPWHILFFAGHSQTIGETGRLAINPQDSLTIAELSYGLQRAISQGLQLAIFNSCDGLGLIHALENLQLPQMIVMREPVPDRVAQGFLCYFLNAFAAGAPLHLAVREARERLQGLEKEFPGASGLPILSQAANVVPPTWISLTGDSPIPVVLPTPPRRLPPWQTLMLVSFFVTSVLTGMRSLGWFQSLELQVFDQWLRLRPPESVDDRILVITVDEADIQYQDERGMIRRGSLSDQALAQLLHKLLPHQPSVIGLDIFHDFEFSLDRSVLKTVPLIATCEIGATAESPSGIAAPPGLTEEALGFSDIPVDPHYIIRRQFLGMTSAAACPTSQSFSLQVALRYLEQQLTASPSKQAISLLQRTPDGKVQIGKIVFPKLMGNTGGYQLHPDEAKGYQVLLNYRQAELQQLSLTSLLESEWDAQLANWVRDRIILIGVDNNKDAHFTPYSQGNFAARMPGVIVQAQMVSQIIHAVLEERPLLRGLPRWGEVILMGLWAGIGGLLGWRMQGVHHETSRSIDQSWAASGLMGLGTIAILIAALIVLWYGVGFGMLLLGWWLPFVSTSLSLVLSSGSMVMWSALPHANSHLPIRSRSS